jgi:aspartyl protease family protein
LVRAQISGRINAIFLLDTGASVTTISTRVARELGINTGFGSPTTEISTASGIVRVPLATVDSIQVGGAEARDVRVVVLDLPEGQQLTGLLGNTFLSRFRVQLDAANAVLTLISQ